MATYTITAEFSLTSSIEPEVRNLRLDTDDYDDNSYWQADDVRCDGGSVTYKVEATDEDDAREQAEGIFYDGMEIEDDNALTWMTEDVQYEVEVDEVPMDKARAVQVIETYIANSNLSDEQKEAFEFMLAFVAGMTT